MQKHHFLITILLLCLYACNATHAPQSRKSAAWKSYSGNPIIEHQVDSVLALMTLDEKIGQMTQFSGYADLTGPVIQADYKKYFDKGLVGSMFNIYGANNLRKLQEENLVHSRLKIPMLFAADVIHGYRTTFPIPLAESCSWDLDLIRKSAHLAAVEATSAGISWTFAPMVDIARDPRWGRVLEGAGEDTYLGSQIAKARVQGFQGIGIAALKDKQTLLACAKHFVAYGAAEAGREYNVVDLSDRKLREIYFPPFQAAVDAGVATFMTAFNEVNEVPCSGNKYLLDDVLRKEWNFKGMVVSDYGSIDQLTDHGIAKDRKEAFELGANAGVDMDMMGAGYVEFLKQSVADGKVKESTINTAAARILELKFLLGLFDDPYRYIDSTREAATLSCPENLAEAQRNAQRSIVLLKNKQQLLPILPQTAKRVALIGPMIKERQSLNGEWAIQGDRSKSVTLYEGLLSNYANSSVTFSYAEGCELQRKYIPAHELPVLKEPSFTEALQVAKNSDIILVALGEDYNWSGESASRTNIQLPAPQQDLLRALKKLGKPIVLVLLNGRPLDLSWEDKNMDAIVEAWYPGTMGGYAIADVLSGKYNPSGKLTMSFPRNIGQIPIYYNHKSTGAAPNPKDPQDYKSQYIDVPNTPLYPFGYGLSYTSFAYSNLQCSSKVLTKGGKIDVSIDVSNQGKYDGEEIVQLYIRDLVGTVTRPVKELKGFQKIALAKGETKTVHFEVNEQTLQMLNINKQWTVEPGDFKLWVASNSDDNSNECNFKYQ